MTDVRGCLIAFSCHFMPAGITCRWSPTSSPAQGSASLCPLRGYPARYQKEALAIPGSFPHLKWSSTVSKLLVDWWKRPPSMLCFKECGQIDDNFKVSIRIFSIVILSCGVILWIFYLLMYVSQFWSLSRGSLAAEGKGSRRYRGRHGIICIGTQWWGGTQLYI